MKNKDQLKVALASWAPFHAGAEVAAERLAIGLREQGHRVLVILGTDGETAVRMRQIDLDVRCVALALTDKLRWWQYRRSQRELRGLLLEFQPDVIHSNDLPTSQMVAQAARRLSIPRLCHHRWVFSGEAIDWLNKFGAEGHLFVSKALMHQLCNESSQLAACQRTVIYDGLPMPVCPTEADRLESRRCLGMPCDKVVVLFAGQIIERKGVADLLRAWQVLQPLWADRAVLFIVGDDLETEGRYRREMERLAAELACGARFEGFQQNVADWIVASDVCVVPSHVEPLGNATLEAMSQSRPVIGSNVGGIPEMIVDGKTGLLIPPRDPASLAAALEKLLPDAELRSRMGVAGRIQCEEHFSLQTHVDAIVAEYRSVLRARADAVA